METVRDETGGIVGKFNLSKATIIATSRAYKNNAGDVILVKTALGNYAICINTMQEADDDQCVAVSREVARGKMEDWNYSVAAITEEFKDYVETETY